ncbi:TlpA family protein disulfide reductase [Ureibacillus sp. 179-F W5.1 NHS]|uniref:TlpA family protein disulfide reductase n=1 Tax=Lysinibacillus halotolerans TaxID=1368476 RepID=A0A3M8H8R9_9BACI|nr:TlpA disulfide reductase family protein [Lysinibacillus halotolerans]RNC98490.1 TlpA family protein disulfide reductase [Lysinibacillus halotolerans]
MKKVIFGLLLIAMIGYAFYEYNSSQSDTTVTSKKTPVISSNTDIEIEETNEVGIRRGNIAPNFTLETLEGEVLSLSDFKGKKVFINFWATWCPPCRAEMPDIQKFSEDEDVLVLAINLTHTEDSLLTVDNFIQEKGFDFPVLVDENGEVAELFRVQAYPTSYMIDTSGRIQFVALGAMNYDLMVKEYKKLK